MSRHFQSGQHPDADQISAFVDHALPSHEQEEMLAHLAECVDCRETVVLSLPAIESVPTATVTESRKSWFWGMRLVWPAAALAGLTGVLLYVHHSANSHQGRGGSGPEVALEQPAAPARGVEAPAAGAENAKGTEGQRQPESQPKTAAIHPGVPAPRALKVPSAGGGVGGSSSPTVRELEATGNAQRQAARPPEEKPENVLQSAAAGTQLAVDATRKIAELHLPGGVMAISAVKRGRQVLALDDRNAVFLSNDGGASWIAVQVPWKGRAVKAELVSYPVRAPSREKSAAGEIQQSGASAAMNDEAVNSPDAARFEAQKSLRQELKGSYRAPTDGSGAANGAASTPPPAASTAPAPGVSTESQGILTGTITDRIGAVIPGASVAITNPANHKTTTAVTGADGKYRIDGLAAGTYQLEARASGFRATTLSAIPIAASSSNTTNVTLEVGAASETVMVQSEAPEIETTSPDLGSNSISRKQKSALAKAARVFEITTDAGDRWTSADGVNWHRL